MIKVIKELIVTYCVPFLVALTTLGFTILSYAMVSSYQNQLQVTEFRQQAADQATAIEQKLTNLLLLIDAMHSLYSDPNMQPGREFTAFTKPFEQQFEGLQALQWVVRVPREDREQFEEAIQKSGVDGFRIVERQSQGVMVPAMPRDVHYPVYPIPPVDTSEPSLGFDLASNPVRRRALERAVASGSTVVSERITLLSFGRRDSAPRSGIS